MVIFMIEHGSFQMEVIDQTLVVKCFDAWNTETVVRMCKEYKELVKTIKDKPWACLVDLSQWELSTPDMWEKIDELNEWANQNNQKYEAVICSLSIQRMFLEASHEVLTNVESRFCDDLQEAFNWLQSVGVYNSSS
jgi:hypothetical protein